MAIAAILLGGIGPAGAAAPEPPPEAEPATDLEAQAAALYDEGQVLYSAADYTGAIDKFTEALALSSRPEASFSPDVRGALLYNLATAHDKAFNVEGDLKHLRTARELYGRIVDEAETYGYDAELVGQATEQRDAVDERLREAEAKEPEPEPDPEPPVAAPRQPEPEPADPETDDVRRPGRALTITGLTVAGLGVGASAIWIAGLIGAQRAEDDLAATTSISDENTRIDAFDRGDRANTLALTGAVVSGALVVGGMALFVAGRVIASRRGAATACLPSVGPRTAGLGCTIRF